jgi:hypothetical protein
MSPRQYIFSALLQNPPRRSLPISSNKDQVEKGGGSTIVILFFLGFICFVVSSTAAPPKLLARLRLLEVVEVELISLRSGEGAVGAFSRTRRRAVVGVVD